MLFGYDKKTFPIYLSKEKYKKELDLRLRDSSGNQHYVLIKDFYRFMYRKIQHNENKLLQTIPTTTQY